MSEIEAKNRRRFYVYSSWIPVIPAGIRGGMESNETFVVSKKRRLQNMCSSKEGDTTKDL